MAQRTDLRPSPATPRARRASGLAHRGTLAVAITLGLVAAASCRRPAARGSAGADAGERYRVPAVLPPPGTVAPERRSIDAPLAWLYLVEDPVPTGSAPDVIVGAELPCDYQPEFGNVFADPVHMRVRLRVSYTGQGTPDPSRACATHPVVALPISLGILRLGDYTLGDAAPHGATDPQCAEVPLRVVRDDSSTPTVQQRRVRRCRPGHDEDCAGGGACGALPGAGAVGVCAPPLNPFLVVHRPCPTGTGEIHLDRATPFAMRAAPAQGDFRACLPSCDASHTCAAGLACVPGTGATVCVPQ